MNGTIININLPAGHHPRLDGYVNRNDDGSQYIEVVVTLRPVGDGNNNARASVGVAGGSDILQIPQSAIPDYVVPINANYTLEDFAKDAIGEYLQITL